MTKNLGINNRSNGVVRMHVTTSVTHKPEVRIDLLTFMQIVSIQEISLTASRSKI